MPIACLATPVFAETHDNNDFDVLTFLIQEEDFALEQNKDDSLKELLIAIKDLSGSTHIGRRRRAKNFTLIIDVLYKKNPHAQGDANLLVIPKHLIHEILFAHHAEPLAGHLGVTKTYYKICNKFFWVGLQKDVEKYVKGCPDCQARKGQSNRKSAG